MLISTLAAWFMVASFPSIFVITVPEAIPAPVRTWPTIPLPSWGSAFAKVKTNPVLPADVARDPGEDAPVKGLVPEVIKSSEKYIYKSLKLLFLDLCVVNNQYNES